MIYQHQDQQDDIELIVNQLLHERFILPAGKSLRLIAFRQQPASEGPLYAIQVEENSLSIPNA